MVCPAFCQELQIQSLHVKFLLNVSFKPDSRLFCRDFATPWGIRPCLKQRSGHFVLFHLPEAAGCVRYITTCNAKYFLKKIPLRQVFPSASVSIHAKTAHSCQKQPWAGAFSLCQFVQPYGNVGVRELELVSKVASDSYFSAAMPTTTLHTSKRPAGERAVTLASPSAMAVTTHPHPR